MQIAKKMLNRKALKKAFLQRGCLFQRDTGGRSTSCLPGNHPQPRASSKFQVTSQCQRIREENKVDVKIQTQTAQILRSPKFHEDPEFGDVSHLHQEKNQNHHAQSVGC